jgi:hypothetical protein
MAPRSTNLGSVKPKIRLIPKLKKAKDPYHSEGSMSYLRIWGQLHSQFPDADRELVLTELARIGTEYAVMLWDLPESTNTQVIDSIINVSNRAQELENALIKLGPLAREFIYQEWLPDPKAFNPTLDGWLAYRRKPEIPPIDEPIRVLERQAEILIGSNEFQWLSKLVKLKEKWSPLREEIRKQRTSAKKPESMPGRQLSEDCDSFLKKLHLESREVKCSFPLSPHGLARKIHEVVTDQKPGGQQFR